MELLKPKLYQDKWMQELPSDIYTAFANRRKVHLLPSGATQEGNIRESAIAQLNRQNVEAGVAAGSVPASVRLKTHDFIKAPDQVEVTDMNEYRRLVRFCYRILPDAYKSFSEDEMVDRIMAHEQAHFDVGSRISTLTPHFTVTFIEDIRTHIPWMKPAIYWAGTCTAQEYDAIQKAPEHLSQSDSLSERIIGDLA